MLLIQEYQMPFPRVDRSTHNITGLEENFDVVIRAMRQELTHADGNDTFASLDWHFLLQVGPSGAMVHPSVPTNGSDRRELILNDRDF